MIRRLSIQNFRCIRQAEIELGPFTILVGPNASGKSTVLRALSSFKIEQANCWRKNNDFQPFLLAVDDQGISFRYSTPGPADVESRAGEIFSRWLPLKKQAIRLDVDSLRAPNRVARATGLSPSGDNLANVIGSLTRRQQEQLSQTFCRLVPVFSDLDLQPISDGMHELRFQDRWSEAVWYRPEQVSDGTMLMVAFLTLQYQVEPVQLLTIEEPDRGLHPYLMEQVISFLRKLSRPRDPSVSPVQVVIATHSAELLEHCLPEEVRFLDRNAEDGSLRVHQVDTSSTDWKETFETYRNSLGSVWLSGGLGGVPGR
jgi:predicted ATPase